jgi:hypothetical protein
VAQLSIALAIFIAAVFAIYAVERLWFRQDRTRALSITLWAGVSDLILPLACVCLVQTMIFGRQRAEAMQPSIFLKRVYSALERREPNE